MQNSIKDAHIAAIRELSGALSTYAIAGFLFISLYVAIATVGTTDAQLLSDGAGLNLPFISVAVPVTLFYITAPLIYFVLHVNLIFLVSLATHKIDKYLDSGGHLSILHSKLTSSSLPVIHIIGTDSTPHRVLAALVYNLLAIYMPPFLIFTMLVRFVPYQSWKISAWHALVLMSDMALTLWTLVSMTRRRSLRKRIKSSLPVAVVCVGLIAISCTLIASASPLFSCGNGYFAGFPISLNVAGQVLASDATGKGKLNFSQRSLRCANFKDTEMVGADFRGADLRGARFDGAKLRGSDFSYFPEEHLDQAVWRGRACSVGKIKGKVSLLAGVKFVGSDISRAYFVSANLGGADFSGAGGLGAVFCFARLGEASMLDADFGGADFSYAELTGAEAQGAHFILANFRSAQVGADFRGADLRGADLTSANTIGADLREAHLDLARTTGFTATLLRGAFLGRADLCQGSSTLRFDTVDLRDITFESDPLSAEDLTRISAIEGIGNKLKSIWFDEENHSRSHLSQRQVVCSRLGGVLWRTRRASALKNLGLLYSPVRSAPWKWPASDLAVDEFDLQIADKFHEFFCKSKIERRRAIVRGSYRFPIAIREKFIERLRNGCAEIS